ncbi:hypothetical protein ACHQM5_020353 [Ranunculus cassubicifolius]
MEATQSPDQPKNSKGKSYVVWTNEMDRVLTETFLDQIQKGNKSGQGWKPETWTATVDAIKEKCGKQVTKDNVQARLKTWTKNYNIMKELKDQSGFGWDENRKMIDVNDDVWEGYVKSHPDARSYRYKALTNYDDLSIIIGNANAKGGGAITGSELSKAREEQNKSDSDVEEITYENDGAEKNEKQQKATSSRTSTSKPATRKTGISYRQ